MQRILVLVFFILSCLTSQAQVPLRKITNTAFGVNEILEYRIHYGFVDAGEATLEVTPDMKQMGNRSCFHIVGKGKTTGAFDWFFKVRDQYESYVDADAMLPWLFVRRVNEGGYKINQNVSFNHYKNTAASEKKTIITPSHTQDLISAFYYARTIDFAHAAVGDTFLIYTYLDDETFPLVIKYMGKETIKTSMGKFRCIVFKPYLLEGRVFKEKEGMTLWVSDDKNKIPIRVEAVVLVGSIKMDLKGYKGVASPLALIKD